MNVGLPSVQEATAGGEEWQSFQGAHVVLYARPGSAATEYAPQGLRNAELVVEALRRLLAPDAEQAAQPVRIYVSDDAEPSLDQAREAVPATDEPLTPSDSESREPEPAEHVLRDSDRESALPDLSEEGGRVVRAVQHEGSDEPLAWSITRCVIEQWFGARAASAAVFVEGIAGLAAASAGMGITADEADRWVREELHAGRKVRLTGDQAKRAEKSNKSEQSGKEALDAPGEFNPAAISFIAFLIANNGPQALGAYLRAYDPSRLDYAANVAYRQPLAVLEEEWRTRMSRIGTGDALRTFLRQIIPLLKPYKWKQLEILVYLLLAAGYNVVQPYAIKTVIDRLTAQVRAGSGPATAGPVFMKVLAPLLFILFGIYVLNGLVSLRRAYTVNWLNQNVLNTMQIRMYSHLQRLAHNFYLKSKIGDLMARLNDDLDNVQSALAQVTNKALYQIFTVTGAVTALCMLTRTSPALAIPILCIIPIFGINYAALRTRNKQASREQRRRAGQAMADVQEHLSAHALIKAFRLEEKTIADYRARIQALQKSKLRLALLNALTDLSEDMTTALAQLVIFGVGGYLVLRDGAKGLGVGDLTALLVLVKSIFGPIASLAGTGQTLQQATGAMERVTELMSEPVTIADKPGAPALAPMTRDIRLENVTFAYGGDRPALRDLSLTIPACANVAIVGPSGAGKSSTVNLLMRFWDPEKGRVLFDGVDLREVTLGSLRDQIGLVFQETFVFDTTLRENIAIGRPGATDAEIAEAAKAAQLDRFIESLPAGYDTIPGENGARLSTGQKQRIAIARTFLRNPRILILDEATSALDANTEAGVLVTLRELAKGRTTISVTHRIAQAAAADLIFVIETGRLVEQGTHDDLMRAGGLYRKLYEEATGFVPNGLSQPPAVEAPKSGRRFSSRSDGSPAGPTGDLAAAGRDPASWRSTDRGWRGAASR